MKVTEVDHSWLGRQLSFRWPFPIHPRFPHSLPYSPLLPGWGHWGYQLLSPGLNNQLPVLQIPVHTPDLFPSWQKEVFRGRVWSQLSSLQTNSSAWPSAWLEALTTAVLKWSHSLSGGTCWSHRTAFHTSCLTGSHPRLHRPEPGLNLARPAGLQLEASSLKKRP